MGIKIILASASLGRKHLLKQLKIPFKVVPTHIDEEQIQMKTPLETIQMRAQLKSKEAFKKILTKTKYLIITADTEVVLHNRIVGKPKDFDDGIRIFRLLSGNTHEVISALHVIKVISGKIDKSWITFDKSSVTFRKLNDAEIKRYLSLTDYKRYTGGYALAKSPQDFIIKIDGSVSNVIGMPLEKLIEIFEEEKILH